MMPKFWIRFFKVILIATIPLVVILGVVRLVATEPYLAFEHAKPDFPEDLFGFDRSQRHAFATASLRFITDDQPLAELASQNQNGSPLYNERELSHMKDVQNTFQTVIRLWQIALLLAVVSSLALLYPTETRPDFAFALRVGGAITTGLIVVIGLAAIAAWQSWFVVFHEVFFAAGTWTFDPSNTLIRLFPEKFWYDTALTISNLSPLVAILIYGIGYVVMKRNKGGRGAPIKPGLHNADSSI